MDGMSVGGLSTVIDPLASKLPRQDLDWIIKLRSF